MLGRLDRERSSRSAMQHANSRGVHAGPLQFRSNVLNQDREWVSAVGASPGVLTNYQARWNVVLRFYYRDKQNAFRALEMEQHRCAPKWQVAGNHGELVRSPGKPGLEAMFRQEIPESFCAMRRTYFSDFFQIAHLHDSVFLKGGNGSTSFLERFPYQPFSANFPERL